MAEKTTNYQCPACTGPLHYDGASGKLVCDYCGSAYDVKDIEARYAKKQAAADTAAEGDAKKAASLPRQDSPVWSEAEAEGLNSYSCPTCGAELVCDETTAATTCPYCGNPTVLGGKLSGKLKPEYILPFKLDKKAAITQLTRYYKGKAFLPKAFKSQNHIAEIQGVYVPFWLYDAKADARGVRGPELREPPRGRLHGDHHPALRCAPRGLGRLCQGAGGWLQQDAQHPHGCH